MSDGVTDYDLLGGEDGLERVIDAMVERFAADFIIGFLFEGRDLPRIKRHELELASSHLGGPHTYAGRPIGATHRPLKINRGQFRRRLALVRTVLGEQGVPVDVIDRWVAFESRLESAITDGTDCVEPL